MNSGIDPLLLPKGQLAYAQNGTVRGDFLRQRPAYNTIVLSYDQASTQIHFQTGLFQGRSYYKPDTGPESIMAAIAGGLFQITPGTGATAVVTEKTIPGNPNPAGLTQAWLFQAENYLITNDGVSAPLIFDGTNTFRSNNGLQTVLGVVGLNFTVPAVGSSVTINLIAPFAGTAGQTVLIDNATYQTITPTGTYQASLTNFNDTAGTVYPVGIQIIYNPNVLFYVNNPLAEGWSGGTFTTPTAIPANTYGFPINIPANYAGSFGGLFTWGGIIWQVVGSIDANGTQHGNMGGLTIPGSLVYPLVVIMNTQTVPTSFSQTITLGQPFYQNGASLPVQVVGTLDTPLTVPAQGVTVTATLVTAYTGLSNLAVEINGSLYTILALTAAAPGSTSLTLINVNDVPLNTVTAPTNILSVPQLPTGRMGTYGMGRIWLSLPDGLSFLAGDIVGGSSGTVQNNFRDAILNITENEYLAGGGTFRVPGSVGDIKAMQFIALLDASLGQGPLQVFTTQNTFGCQAPVDRTTWQSLTNPILVESLKGSGGVSQDAVSPANGDLLFRSADGNVRSLLMARLDFNRWGNTPISLEMQRVLELENQSLLGYDSSAEFDNRYLLAAMPTQSSRGVYHTSILALNFDPLSSLRGKQESVWDGEWTGLNVLKIISRFFNGVERCFALCLSSDLTQIELHEILPTATANYDNGSTPITAWFESPMLDFGDRKSGGHTYKRLKYGEIFVDGIVGPVQFQAFYKPDQWPNWVPWYSWTQTYTANTDPGFRPRVGLPMPDGTVFDTVNNRPLREGFNFQVKLVMTGPCRFLGARFAADVIPQPEFAVPVI